MMSFDATNPSLRRLLPVLLRAQRVLQSAYGESKLATPSSRPYRPWLRTPKAGCGELSNARSITSSHRYNRPVGAFLSSYSSSAELCAGIYPPENRRSSTTFLSPSPNLPPAKSSSHLVNPLVTTLTFLAFSLLKLNNTTNQHVSNSRCSSTRFTTS